MIDLTEGQGGEEALYPGRPRCEELTSEVVWCSFYCTMFPLSSGEETLPGLQPPSGDVLRGLTSLDPYLTRAGLI
ncbi:hypothetical protein ElyMa_002781600 [Elysia marginata]|uniref:Uncharacterized protein n=1 Tax=Elysia marginata TaxID=1093978 RepID=A0AAV4HLC7_9GAST|nr:hypothetical protein ElyMa_002781600 [Elysia marginata]